jgi:hypothetical protein
MKKIILNESERKAVILDREKAIIENFGKIFNKIKRIDENEVTSLETKELGKTPIIDPRVSKEILKTINTLGQEDGTIYDIKIIDERPNKENTKNIAVKVKGDNLIPVTTATNEGIKSNIIKGVVCTILASGMVSCTKQNNTGFGYNNGAKVTTYQINPDSENSKTVFAYSSDGLKSAVVDSTASQSNWSGSGTIFKIKPTVEQLKIMAFGNMINTEINRNNGRGTDGYIMDVTDIEVKENPSYSSNSGKPLNSIEEDGNYITGKNHKESNPKAWDDFLNKFGGKF